MKFYGWLLLSIYLIVFGCAKPEITEIMLEAKFQEAQQAINDAADLEAESLVPEEFGRAVKLLNFARDSYQNGDMPQSAAFADQAELVGQIATAKARQHHARQKGVTIREQTYQQIIAAFEHELEISRIRQAITEAQLADALRARDSGEQKKSELSTKIADLETRLRQAELRAPIANAELLVSIATDIYPAIRETADYERTQAKINSALNLIERAAFTEAEGLKTEAETLVNNLYQLAVKNQQAVAVARLDARVAIAQAEVILQRAQILNATEHAPRQFQEASTQLQGARQEFDVNRYEQAKQSAQQAQQTADEVVATAELKEYQQRAQQELNALITRAEQAVEGLGEKISAQAETEVSQLEAQLYQLANSAYEKAISALVAKEYQLAIDAAEEGDDYLQRAIVGTVQVTTAKSELVSASKQIPKVTNVIEQRDSVLIRINGNVFAHGSTQIQKGFFRTFAQLAQVLQTAEFSNYPVHIEVHTSSLGNANVNQNVSMGRADSIKKFLITNGRMGEDRITAVGLGENQPVVKDGPNKEERNRRVDIIIKTN